ncbi:MAG: hypothetical protein J0I84_13485 [Terrimonas sp.]|nr:hypothetical protein [Terrimonas sp.]OJY90023.1 MAG: hypothetical protein BGP13_23290 [Sphingobacteriales bacterium 40-81]
MKKVFMYVAVVVITLLGLSNVNAQEGGNYKNGIGLRAGGGYYDVIAASYKTFVTEPGAIELNLGFRPYAAVYSNYNQFHLSFSASYQHHFPIGSVEGLRWFVGGGLTAYNTFSSNKDFAGFGLGLFPTGGVDYKFSNIPLNVSADFRPTFAIVRPDYYGYSYFSTYSRFYAGNVGASVRYTF